MTMMVDGGGPVKEKRVADCGVGEEECGSGDPSPSSSTSSIGRDSDVSGASSVDDGEAEVQSSYKGALDRMEDLEDSLPMRRGISNFYCGKSKSFTSLADVSSSAKDLAKADNPYNRKRKNLLAAHMMFNRNKNSSFRRSTGNIPKRPANSSFKETGLSASRSSSGSSTSEESMPSRLPPMHRKGMTDHPNGANSPLHQLCFASRSFSLVNLQNASSGSPVCAKD